MIKFLQRLLGHRKGSDNVPRSEWVDTKAIQPGQRLYEHLNEDQQSQIRLIHETFAEVDGFSFDKRLDDFTRDWDPDRELTLWLRILKAYKMFCGSHELSIDGKKDVYRVLLMRSMMSKADVRSRIKLQEISIDHANEIMELFVQ